MDVDPIDKITAIAEQIKAVANIIGNCADEDIITNFSDLSNACLLISEKSEEIQQIAQESKV